MGMLQTSISNSSTSASSTEFHCPTMLEIRRSGDGQDFQLVGGIPTPLKNMKVSWDDYSQYMEKKCSKPPISSRYNPGIKAGKNIRLFFLGQENINMIIHKQEFL